MKIILNGKDENVADGATVAGLLESRGIAPESAAVDVNGDLVRKHERAARVLKEGDHVEVVRMIAGGSPSASGPAADGPLVIAGKSFESRLLLGTGRYPSFEHMRRCHARSGTEIVTLAVGRHDLAAPGAANILDFIDRAKLTLLPNTAGAYSVREALRLARLSRELLATEWIKLEVLSDQETLWPDTAGTVAACRELVKDGFTVLAYTTDDPVVARRLEDEGAAAIMPLGSMIGSGQGVLNPLNLRMIKARAGVPVVCDAGIGCASDAAVAMELGLDAVLCNTAVSQAQDPESMAEAMRWAVRAGRLSYLAGRIPRHDHAEASSRGAGLGRQAGA
ncbi:MAG TPA: sulfur carrier protein ThiS [bacterium]|jgi:thiazole synthase|nr:sulfur carrier protein ThiS [bacterium]